MRKLVCVILFLLAIKTTIAQDTIIRTNGHSIIAVVLEVGTTEIKYKKFATQATSPVYDIYKYQVSEIRYHDGTIDKFSNGNMPVAYPYNPYYYSPMLDSNTTGISGAFMYCSFMASPLNMYNGAPINNYWQDLYTGDPHKGILGMNSGNSMMYTAVFGASLEFNKRSTWSYEFQFDFTPKKAIYNSASYSDTTGGTLSMRYFGFNDLIQYTHALDTADRWQLGGEASLDIGLMSGTERDSLYYPSALYYGNPTTITSDYDAMHLGGHIAAVAIYFMGKKKGIGLEMRLGYRFMKMSSASEFDPGNGYNGNIDWSGPFFSFGIVLRTRAYYSINDSPYYY